MPVIRLLTSVVGGGPVSGARGDEIHVDGPTAQAWADGVRAELVREPVVERAVVTAPERTVRKTK